MSNKPSYRQDEIQKKAAKKPTGQVVREELKFFAGLGLFLLLFFNLIFGHFKIPSESMLPTLEVGDHLYVNKFVYGISRESLTWPFRKMPLPDGRFLGKPPKRGDVIVFRNPKSGLIMIKRLAALPGDTIETRKGKLYINGKLIPRTQEATFSYREHRGLVQEVVQYKEQLPGESRAHRIYERSDIDRLDNKGPFVIPEGKLFFMGDNRDNSEDSRAPNGPGFVPIEFVIGKAQMMVYSLHRCEAESGLRCPGRRFFIKL